MMGTILASVFSGGSAAAIKVIAIVVVILGLVGLGAYGQAKIDANALTKQTLQYQQAVAAANQVAADEQHSIDQDALAASGTEAAQVTQENATLSAELANVQKHLDVKYIPCIPWGFVRLHDAAVLRVTADSLALPAGKSDNSCSTFTATQLAEAIIGNYNRAIHNANQLNALIAYDKKVQSDEAATAAKKAK
jgi:uncharacterized membrane protein (Fun14 family)